MSPFQCISLKEDGGRSGEVQLQRLIRARRLLGLGPEISLAKVKALMAYLKFDYTANVLQQLEKRRMVVERDFVDLSQRVTDYDLIRSSFPHSFFAESLGLECVN